MTADDPQELSQYLRDIKDFPRPGIVFKDITPLLLDGPAFARSVSHMERAVDRDHIHVVAAPEARGFLFGAALAQRLGCGFVPIRKAGKLPYETTSITYDLEYGQDTIHMHVDAVNPGDGVLLVDDVLATGGTMRACADLVESRGAQVRSCVFLLEISALGGRSLLKDYRITSLIKA